MTEPSAPCEKLPWDSEFFGLSIARAVTRSVDAAGCDAMLSWCRANRIDCLYFLCPLADAGTQRQLGDAAFQLVDVRVTLTRHHGAGAGEVRGATRLATLADIPGLRGIAAVSHRDTRFHTDGHFDAARCDELYATWIEKSVRGYADHVIVADRENEAVGYVTLHIERVGADAAPAARIGLVGVAARWQNQGIGRDLMRHAARLLADGGVTTTSVVTGGRNVGALRLYKSEGFSTNDVSLWYHRWFRDSGR
jgi:ribosomal protein S18 acetylase RimI-like enzyme